MCRHVLFPLLLSRELVGQAAVNDLCFDRFLTYWVLLLIIVTHRVHLTFEQVLALGTYG